MCFPDATAGRYDQSPYRPFSIAVYHPHWLRMIRRHQRFGRRVTVTMDFSPLSSAFSAACTYRSILLPIITVPLTGLALTWASCCHTMCQSPHQDFGVYGSLTCVDRVAAKSALLPLLCDGPHTTTTAYTKKARWISPPPMVSYHTSSAQG